MCKVDSLIIICNKRFEVLVKNLCIDFESTFVKYSIVHRSSNVLADKLRFIDPCVNEGNRYELCIEQID